MQRSMKEIMGYQILATDGAIGRCKDFLVDDRYWTVRYIVVDTGRWLSERKVIVTPSLVGEPDWNRQALPVLLSRSELEEAPPIDKDAPVSRKYEQQWLERFNQPFYWGPVGPTAAAVIPSVSPIGQVERQEAERLAREEAGTTRLRSMKEVTGYGIRAADGDIGEVDNFILDDTTWMLRYIVVNTRKWLPGGKVLLSTDWIKSVDWINRVVEIDATVEEVKQSPPFDPAQGVNREYEVRLYDYYGRPKYWLNR